MKGQLVLVVGAGSGIGAALVRELAAGGADCILAGRRVAELERQAADLRVRSGVRSAALAFDATDPAAADSLVAGSSEVLGGEVDGVILCHGVMAEQEDAEADVEQALHMIEVNLVSYVALLERFAKRFETRGHGFACALSSVAGDRGRAGNYLYGATKAGLSAYMEGLDARLRPSGAFATCVRPGPVDTALTWGSPAPLLASPERVARDIVRGLRRRRSKVYTPPVWAAIMALLRWLPAPVFRRLPI